MRPPPPADVAAVAAQLEKAAQLLNATYQQRTGADQPKKDWVKKKKDNAKGDGKKGKPQTGPARTNYNDIDGGKGPCLTCKGFHADCTTCPNQCASKDQFFNGEKALTEKRYCGFYAASEKRQCGGAGDLLRHHGEMLKPGPMKDEYLKKSEERKQRWLQAKGGGKGHGKDKGGKHAHFTVFRTREDGGLGEDVLRNILELEEQQDLDDHVPCHGVLRSPPGPHVKMLPFCVKERVEETLAAVLLRSRAVRNLRSFPTLQA